MRDVSRPNGRWLVSRMGPGMSRRPAVCFARPRVPMPLATSTIAKPWAAGLATPGDRAGTAAREAAPVTGVTPAGAPEYRLRYPADRNLAPDAAVARVQWFYPFHERGSFLLDVEQSLFLRKRSLDVEANQNRSTLAVQVVF